MNVNFKANYVSSAQIYKRDAGSGNYKPFEASFIEFDSNFYKDVIAIKDTAERWKRTDRFACEIAEDIAFNNAYGYERGEHRFFGLTRQKSDFENPKASKILGLIEVSDSDRRGKYINFLQVEPKNTLTKVGREFCGVGSAIIDNVKNLFSDCEIKLKSLPEKEVVNFYKKNGFEQIGKSIDFVWHGIKGKGI